MARDWLGIQGKKLLVRSETCSNPSDSKFRKKIGCKCEACKEAFKATMRISMENGIRIWNSCNQSRVVHGTDAAAWIDHCTCTICSRAWKEKYPDYSRRNFARVQLLKSYFFPDGLVGLDYYAKSNPIKPGGRICFLAHYPSKTLLITEGYRNLKRDFIALTERESFRTWFAAAYPDANPY